MIHDFIVRVITNYEYRFNSKKYWYRRLYIQNTPHTFFGGVKKKIYLIWLKNQEAKFSSTTGTGAGSLESPCCVFNKELFFPHGLCGIVFARNVMFQGDATVFQHVTIAESDRSKTTTIGCNVEIGAGAVILNNVNIGNNVKIGANAVVTKDIPNNAVVVGVPAKIIKYNL